MIECKQLAGPSSLVGNSGAEPTGDAGRESSPASKGSGQATRRGPRRQRPLRWGSRGPGKGRERSRVSGSGPAVGLEPRGRGGRGRCIGVASGFHLALWLPRQCPVPGGTRWSAGVSFMEREAERLFRVFILLLIPIETFCSVVLVAFPS